MDQQAAYILKAELRQFTGSETFYRHSLFRKFIYTEGVQYLAEKAVAYWLLDHIFANQAEKHIGVEPFQVWKITVNEDESALISVEDGNDRLIHQHPLNCTDFPLDKFSLWLVHGTLLLPSEY